jgi:hypothetical protein
MPWALTAESVFDEKRARGFDDGCLARRRPACAGMMVRAYACLIGEEYRRVFALGSSGNLWILFLAPGFN